MSPNDSLYRQEVAGPLTPSDCDYCYLGGYYLEEGDTYSANLAISDKGDLIAVGGPYQGSSDGAVWLYQVRKYFIG